MTNLLSIEQSFLNLSIVKENLNLGNIKRIQNGITNAKKKKFEQTLTLSTLVLKSFEWFTSEEGKRICAEEGISWSNEEFGMKVYGYQKSFFYKLTRCGKLENETVENFKAKCDEIDANGGYSKRNLENLLKFAKNPECFDETEESEESEESEKTETIFTLSFKSNTNVAVRVNADNVVKTTNSKDEILQAIAFLLSQID
jgi:hypothetical protein